MTSLTDNLHPVLENVLSQLQDTTKYLAQHYKTFDANRTYNTLTINHEDATKFYLPHIYFFVVVLAASARLMYLRGKSASFSYIIMATLISIFTGHTILSFLAGSRPPWLTEEYLVLQAVAVSFLSIAGLRVYQYIFPIRFVIDCILVITSINHLIYGYNVGEIVYKTHTAAIILAFIGSSTRSILIELEPLLWGETFADLPTFEGPRLYFALTLLFAGLKYAQIPISTAYVTLVAIGIFWSFVRVIWRAIDVWWLPESILNAIVYVPSSTPLTKVPKTKAITATPAVTTAAPAFLNRNPNPSQKASQQNKVKGKNNK